VLSFGFDRGSSSGVATTPADFAMLGAQRVKGALRCWKKMVVLASGGTDDLILIQTCAWA